MTLAIAWRIDCRGARVGAEEPFRRGWQWSLWVIMVDDGECQWMSVDDTGLRICGEWGRYLRMTWVLAKSHKLHYFWRRYQLPCSTNPTPSEHFGKGKTFVKAEGNKARPNPTQIHRCFRKEGVDYKGQSLPQSPPCPLKSHWNAWLVWKGTRDPALTSNKWHLVALNRL